MTALLIVLWIMFFAVATCLIGVCIRNIVQWAADDTQKRNEDYHG
jgi:sensor domain CHASE-containing protein